MKNLLLVGFALFLSQISMAGESIVGFWTTIDDETKSPKSIVQIYEYQGKYFGRVVDLFKNKEATAKIKGSPKIKGLDIIWDLKKNNHKYTGGEILDPVKGKVYGCEIYREGEKLIVRGKIAFLGRNQIWLRNTDFSSKNLTENLIPVKPL